MDHLLWHDAFRLDAAVSNCGGTLLNTSHIDEGLIGGWQKALTQPQVEVIYSIAGEWLRENEDKVNSGF